MMLISERLKRNNSEDQIEIGTIIDSALSGAFSEVFRSIIEGIKEEAIERSKKPEVSADRTVGVLQGLLDLQNRLDQCVEIKNELTAAKKAASEV